MSWQNAFTPRHCSAVSCRLSGFPQYARGCVKMRKGSVTRHVPDWMTVWIAGITLPSARQPTWTIRELTASPPAREEVAASHTAPDVACRSLTLLDADESKPTSSHWLAVQNQSDSVVLYAVAPVCTPTVSTPSCRPRPRIWPVHRAAPTPLLRLGY